MRRRAIISWRRAPLVVVGLWCAFFAALESARTVRIFQNQPWSDTRPSLWRLGAEPVERLERFLATMETHLPAHSRVAFATALASEEEAAITARWAAYLLPRHHVFAATTGNRPAAEYWLVYGEPTAHASPPPASVLVAASTAGSLYRAADAAP